MRVSALPTSSRRFARRVFKAGMYLHDGLHAGDRICVVDDVVEAIGRSVNEGRKLVEDDARVNRAQTVELKHAPTWLLLPGKGEPERWCLRLGE